MGFFTTYIIIGFLGYFSHKWYHKYGLRKGHVAWIAWYSMIVVTGFLVYDFLMYFGMFDTTIIPLLNMIPWVNIDNGLDYMWNSFQLFGIDFNIPYDSPGLLSIGILLFLSYLPWYLYFKLLSRQMFGGNKRFEEGLWWFMGPTKKPKGDEASYAPE